MARLAFALAMQLIFMSARPAPLIQEQAVPKRQAGNIHGVVVDRGNEGVPDAGVKTINRASQEYSLRANSSGKYDCSPFSQTNQNRQLANSSVASCRSVLQKTVF